MKARSIGAVVYRGRYTTEIPHDFVVFLIGMRLNRPWKVHKWFPVFLAMPRMLRWLDQHPEAGLLQWHHAWVNGPAVVQYWRSFEHSTGSPAQQINPTCRHGSGSTTRSARPATWASGTRRTRCTPESTNASTATCPASVSGQSACTCPLAPPVNRPHDASAPPTSTSRHSPHTPIPETLSITNTANQSMASGDRATAHQQPAGQRRSSKRSSAAESPLASKRAAPSLA